MNKTVLPIEYVKQSLFSEPVMTEINTYEFIYILSGGCQLLFRDSFADYAENDLCLLTPGTVCQILPAGSASLLRIGISAPFMEQAMNGTGTFLCDSAKEPNNNYSVQKQQLLRIAAKYDSGQEGHELEIMELLYGLLAVMKRENYLPVLPGQDIPDKYQSRVQAILQYIDLHYQEPLSLSGLADALYLTPAYLSRFFRKYLDTNFKDLLARKRLFHACHDVRYTDDHFTDIAIRNGFSNITVFTRVFRSRLGVTPTEYRRNAHDTAAKDALMETTKVLNLSGKDSTEYEPSSQMIVLRDNNGKSCHNGMTGLINIGNIQNLLDYDFCEQLERARTDYPFRYVRFGGLFRSSFIPRLLSSDEYYFQKADEILTFLYRHDMVPFIELSLLPSANARKKDSLIPKALHRTQRYFDLLEKTLIHIRDFYPPDWTRQWIFELGMAPHDTPDLYIQDYAKIHGLLSRLLPGASLGGYGCRIGGGQSSLSSMLSLFREKGIMPDFISLSASLEIPSEGFSLIDADGSSIQTQIREALKIIRSYFTDIPLYLTEWTSLFDVPFPIYDTCFQSAFICKTAADLIDSCTLAGYWLFREAEIFPPALRKAEAPFWGQGLLSGNNIRLPSFYAFMLLNRMGSIVLQRGDNYLITTDNSGDYQILLYNYAPIVDPLILEKDSPFSSTETGTDSDGSSRFISYPDIYRLFKSVPVHHIILKIQTLVPGTYRMSRYILDRAHGSILDLQIGSYLAGNIPAERCVSLRKDTPAAEMEALRRSAVPEFRVAYQKVEDTFSLDISLAPHAVCYLELTRIEE